MHHNLLGLLVATAAVVSARALPAQSTAAPAAPTYVGSALCGECHTAVYARWSKTRMANVVSDPRQHPEAVIPDFSKANALRTFTLDDVALVYGSKWKQRYFTKVGTEYYPLPAQWDVTNKLWRPYFVQPNTDWWVKFYPADNMKRPTGPLCDGCHSVNYNVSTKTVTEWNVGCEKCHGAGSTHAAKPSRENIVNPARLDFVRANDTCIQCHSQGQPVSNPINGQYYDWPVGFQQGLYLRDFWTLEEHKLGEMTFTHFPDGTAHKNRMQGNDFVQSVMYRRGVTCFECHDAHGTENAADLIKPVGQLCLSCHGSASPNGPHTATLESHTHHVSASAGSECVNCHMPKLAQTIADVNVRSHTFAFITPTLTDQFKIPNACTTCHVGKSTEWARDALRGWKNVSPWRGQ
ncbi:MAG: cytochrome C [Gemmatimonadaceae bacterium]|nr:cytochrome C [Gemmatimonadaceae bacterium]